MSAEWTEGRYGAHTLNLELFTIDVFWGVTKNSAGVNGYQWKASTGASSARDIRFGSLEEAKERAERWARKALTRATALCPARPARAAEKAGGGS